MRPARCPPGTVDLVRSVPRKYVRSTLSNTNALQWPRLLNQRDLAEAFDHHFPSHLTGRIKPDEEAFQHVLDTLVRAPPKPCFWTTAGSTSQPPGDSGSPLPGARASGGPTRPA
ncbi:hypothetical protein SBA4_2730003 [Candidatus Sulfopaludibacter sp. SbA4]|nr:hypothetical protein SBA4_2730003 [Candidatus Sulfopaludibacter sp. SbA4]